MSDLINNLDLTRQESATIDEETANIITQLQSWHEARCDQLQMIVDLPDDKALRLGDTEITDKRDIALFKAGVHTALNMFSKLPININERD
jgi:hypothetical protein